MNKEYPRNTLTTLIRIECYVLRWIKQLNITDTHNNHQSPQRNYSINKV